MYEARLKHVIGSGRRRKMDDGARVAVRCWDVVDVGDAAGVELRRYRSVLVRDLKTLVEPYLRISLALR